MLFWPLTFSADIRIFNDKPYSIKRFYVLCSLHTSERYRQKGFHALLASGLIADIQIFNDTPCSIQRFYAVVLYMQKLL